MQSDNITTNLKVKIYFTLPELSTAEILTWNCHMDYSANIRYDMILGRDILLALVLNIKFSEHLIKEDDGTLEGSTDPMLDMGTYKLKIYIEGKFHWKNR